jgi:hypothetical protein
MARKRRLPVILATAGVRGQRNRGSLPHARNCRFPGNGKHFYLESCGTDAVGTITGRSFRIEQGRIATPYETLTYEFTTSQGRTIKDKLDRPVHELSGIADGENVTVAYWERFPIINSPRGVRRGNR